MDKFNFPRESSASSNHITADAVRNSVARLTFGLEEVFLDNRDFRDWLRGDDGWRIKEVLEVGAVCALLKGHDPKVDYDAALVRQALADRLSVNLVALPG
ncbi:hypothetical protein ACVIGB_000901 [Bradyrhizobium sp. USDA 4341]